MLRKKIKILYTALITAALIALFASPAAATAVYTDVLTGGFEWTSIQETSTFGDPEPLFGQPIGSGGSLLFFPPNFTASAAGAGGFDQTGSQLQLQVEFDQPDTPILSLEFQEFGDTLLLGTGTAGTGTFIGISGFVTVLDVINVNNTGLNTVIPFIGTVTPSAVTGLPGDFGVGLWEANVFVDIAAVVPDATVVMLSLDNDLTAFSEDGTSAKIQKKVSQGVVVTPTPEPSTMMLLGGGLLVSALVTRRRRG